jgi:hypothetical protein
LAAAALTWVELTECPQSSSTILVTLRVQKIRINLVGHVCVFVGCVLLHPNRKPHWPAPGELRASPFPGTQIVKSPITEETLHPHPFRVSQLQLSKQIIPEPETSVTTALMLLAGGFYICRCISKKLPS